MIAALLTKARAARKMLAGHYATCACGKEHDVRNISRAKPRRVVIRCKCNKRLNIYPKALFGLRWPTVDVKECVD